MHRWDPIAPPPRGLVRPVRVDATGSAGPTRGQAAGPRWRRTTKGYYVPADTPQSVEQRVLEHSVLVRDGGVVTGWAALRLHGGNFFDGVAPDGRTELPMPIAANGDRLRETAGIRLDRGTLHPAEVVTRHGIRCACVERALFDEMVHRDDVREAAVAMDMTAAAQLTSIARMRRYVTWRAGARGVRLVSAALGLADEGARSPQESRLRMVWEIDAEWERPLTNRAVYDVSGSFLGTPDLLDPVRGVVGEYAGADHRDRARHVSDVRREDLFRRAGLEYVEVVGPDLHDRDLVVDRIHAAGERAGRFPQHWRLGPPLMSLDEVLDRADALRALRAE